MKVYFVEEHIPYEGSTVFGPYSSEEKARAYALEMVEKYRAYPDGPNSWAYGWQVNSAKEAKELEIDEKNMIYIYGREIE